jgi:1-hydroxycarotenoid 3,4-desaturase
VSVPAGRDDAVVVGGGVAGLSAAIALAAAGSQVSVAEAARHPGGKIRAWRDGDAAVDVGPTVFTMPWVFDELLAAANTSLSDEVRLEPLEVLAHHRWPDGTTLDLYADHARTRDAIGDFAGRQAVAQYESFCRQSQRIFDALRDTFLTRSQPGLVGLIRNTGAARIGTLSGLQPFRTLWDALESQFDDARLRQLFGRYATYCGSSPFAAPATLMLIAHVERLGVWRIDGGIAALAAALERVAIRLGVAFEYGRFVRRIRIAGRRVSGVELDDGQHIDANRVIVTADTNAVASGAFGADLCEAVAPTPARRRSLSAITWAGTARVEADALACHNVVFSDDYAAEFRQLFGRRTIPNPPTVYLHLPDRGGAAHTAGRERAFMLINAPADGDAAAPSDPQAAAAAVVRQLGACGITLPAGLDELDATGPADFHRRFPATGGALYGPATHGWRAAFRRPGNRTSIAGLYLAGGSVHPGAGVPMAALSGRLAAACAVDDRHRNRRPATRIAS